MYWGSVVYICENRISKFIYWCVSMLNTVIVHLLNAKSCFTLGTQKTLQTINYFYTSDECIMPSLSVKPSCLKASCWNLVPTPYAHTFIRTQMNIVLLGVKLLTHDFSFFLCNCAQYLRLYIILLFYFYSYSSYKSRSYVANASVVDNEVYETRQRGYHVCLPCICRRRVTDGYHLEELAPGKSLPLVWSAFVWRRAWKLYC